MSPILLFLSRIVSAVLVPSAFYVHFRVSLLITKEKKAYRDGSCYASVLGRH